MFQALLGMRPKLRCANREPREIPNFNVNERCPRIHSRDGKNARLRRDQDAARRVSIVPRSSGRRERQRAQVPVGFFLLRDQPPTKTVIGDQKIFGAGGVAFGIETDPIDVAGGS